MMLCSVALLSCDEETRKAQEAAEASRAEAEKIRSEKDALARELSNLRKSYEELNAEREKLLGQGPGAAELVAAVGYGEGEEGPLSPAETVKLLENDLQRVNRNVLPHPTPQEPLTVRVLLLELERAVNVLRQRNREAMLERDNMQQRWRDEEAAKREMMAQKNKEIEDFRARTQRAQERLNQELQQKEGQITELRDRIQNLHAELEKYTEKYGPLEED
jgi:chromosome segregation ATPase